VSYRNSPIFKQPAAGKPLHILGDNVASLAPESPTCISGLAILPCVSDIHTELHQKKMNVIPNISANRIFCILSILWGAVSSLTSLKLFCLRYAIIIFIINTSLERQILEIEYG
jgi:hypothetical protein